MAGHIGDGEDAAARTNFPQSSGGGTLPPTLRAELEKCSTAPLAQDPQHGADVPMADVAGSSRHGAACWWDDDEDDAAALEVVDGDKGPEYFKELVEGLLDDPLEVEIVERNPAPEGQDKPAGQECSQLTNAQMAPLPRVIEGRKKCVPLPQWLKDYKSKVADVDPDGWKIVAVDRLDLSGRKDKYYTHRDYACTFRSRNEVEHFLDTGEAKGKVLMQKVSNTGKVKGKGLLKKSAIDPSGQSSGSRRSSTKLGVSHQPANGPPKEPIGFGRRLVGGMFRNLKEAPPGFL